MAELTREVVMDASPSTIFPFLIDPTQHVRWMGTEADLDALSADITAQIDDALQFAADSPTPELAEINRDIYAPGVLA